MRAFLYFALWIFVAGCAAAQQPAASQPAQAATAPVTAEAILQPAMGNLLETFQGLKIEKWKKGSVRDEAGQNVDAVLRDIQNNMPPLVTAANAAPGALSKSLPLLKHLDALYDVVLRVEEAARVSAPGDQVGAVQQSLLKLGAARIALDDQLQAQAAAQEKEMGDLAAELARARQAPVQQAKASDAPCKPATPPVHKKKRSTTAATPGTQPAPAAKKP